jgi:hypothetical protein
MKESLFPNRLLRPLLPLVAVCVLMLSGSGCACTSVVKSLGTTNTSFSDYRYELSPGRDEIILTSKRKTEYNYLPFYGWLHRKPAWTSISDCEERIPLDPLPGNLRRCELIVETVPDAPEPDYLAPVSRSEFAYAVREDCESLCAGGQYEFEIPTNELPLREGDTLRLRVQPRHLPYLSQPFRIRLVRPYTKEDWYLNNSEQYFMFPVALDGSRYELLTVLRPWDEYHNSAGTREWIDSIYPFRESQREEIMREYSYDDPYDDYQLSTDGEPSFGVICWKALWFPSALVADTVLLPYYAVVWGVAELIRYQRGY